MEKSLVVYDSVYGNTHALAEAICATLGADCRVLAAGEATAADLDGVGLLVVGAPTQGGRPSEGMKRFLGAIPPDALRDTRVAAFDTRLAARDQNAALRLLLKVVGYAAPRISRALVSRGGTPAAPPEGFIVEDKSGPLRPGERERAEAWARRLPAAG